MIKSTSSREESAIMHQLTLLIIFSISLLIFSQTPSWNGCEIFPGFGSAKDNVEIAGGRFNITTLDYITNNECLQSTPDLVWWHFGSYKCINANSASFTREGLFMQPNTLAGEIFGKVLCPHVKLTKGIATTIPVNQISQLCSSLSFNACETFYDSVLFNTSSLGLKRSKAPSCSADSVLVSDGPDLDCVSAEDCSTPCSDY